MVPLLVYTYHRRPAWRAPIAVLIAIILLAPLLLLYYNPFGWLPTGTSGSDSSSIPLAFLSVANWTSRIPWSASLIGPLGGRKVPGELSSIELPQADLPPPSDLTTENWTASKQNLTETAGQKEGSPSPGAVAIQPFDTNASVPAGNAPSKHGRNKSLHLSPSPQALPSSLPVPLTSPENDLTPKDPEAARSAPSSSHPAPTRAASWKQLANKIPPAGKTSRKGVQRRRGRRRKEEKKKIQAAVP